MSAWRPTARLPRRVTSPIARAGFTVDIAMTCSSVKPMPRKRAMISTMLCTVLARPGIVRSVLMQCGVRPWSRTRRPTLKPKFMRPCAVSSHTPRAASSLASGTSFPLVSRTPPGLGGEEMRDDVARLQQREQLADHVRVVALGRITDVDHQRHAALACRALGQARHLHPEDLERGR